MLNDPLANALNNLAVNQGMGKSQSSVRPSNRLVVKVAEILKTHGYISEYSEVKDNKGSAVIMKLSGALNACGVIKPRFAVKLEGFEKFEKRYLPAKGFGILIVSTSKGVMTHNDAKEKKLGGRLLAYVY